MPTSREPYSLRSRYTDMNLHVQDSTQYHLDAPFAAVAMPLVGLSQAWIGLVSEPPSLSSLASSLLALLSCFPEHAGDDLHASKAAR